MQFYSPKQTLTSEELLKTLYSDKVSTKILEKNIEIEVNDIIGVRLNLNVLKNTGVAVQTIHSNDGAKYEENKGLFNGEAIKYAEAVYLGDCFFNVNQSGREKIASGESSKFAMASIDGKFQSYDIPHGFIGIEIKFNPMKQHLFVDENNEAIQYAEYVIVLGHRAFACGKVVYHNLETAPQKVGNIPSQTVINAESKIIDIPIAHSNITNLKINRKHTV